MSQPYCLNKVLDIFWNYSRLINVVGRVPRVLSGLPSCEFLVSFVIAVLFDSNIMKAKVFTFKASYSFHYFKLFSLFLWVTVVRELPLLHGDMSSITDDDGNSTLWSNISANSELVNWT